MYFAAGRLSELSRRALYRVGAAAADCYAHAFLEKLARRLLAYAPARAGDDGGFALDAEIHPSLRSMERAMKRAHVTLLTMAHSIFTAEARTTSPHAFTSFWR